MARTFSKRDGKLRERSMLGVYRCPDEVHYLIEDILILDIVLYLLKRLDPRTYGSEANEAQQTVRRVHFILNAVRNKARDRLAREFLAGQPPVPPRKGEQTLADIWEIFKDGLKKRSNAVEQSVV